ncbi:MAG: hypothetical protein M1838_002540 [Thelocarpon superellum]|nr:MAG: hypothetical protein M1838_002540 [Thelocarpon superellum]
MSPQRLELPLPPLPPPGSSPPTSAPPTMPLSVSVGDISRFHKPLPRDPTWGGFVPDHRPRTAVEAPRDWQHQVLSSYHDGKLGEKHGGSLAVPTSPPGNRSSPRPEIPRIEAPEMDSDDEDLGGIDLTNLCPPIQSPSFSLYSERTPSPRPSTQLVWDPQEETWLRTEEFVPPRAGLSLGPSMPPSSGTPQGLGLAPSPGLPHGLGLSQSSSVPQGLGLRMEVRSPPMPTTPQSTQTTIFFEEEMDLPDEPPPCYVQSQLEEASRRAAFGPPSRPSTRPSTPGLVPDYPPSAEQSPNTRWEAVWARRVSRA